MSPNQSRYNLAQNLEDLHRKQGSPATQNIAECFALIYSGEAFVELDMDIVSTEELPESIQHLLP